MEPMRKAHDQSPFEEPVADYTAAAVAVEQPQGIHIEPAPLPAESPAPWPEEEAASDVFAPAEAPPPAKSEDAANTATMADLYAQQGLPEKARDIYQNILEREPENREVQQKMDNLPSPGASRHPLPPGEGRGEGRNPKVAKLEQWLAKVKKREEGSVV